MHRLKALRIIPLMALVVATTIAVAASPASAAPASDVAVVPIQSGSADLGGYHIAGVEPASLTVFNLDITAHATWKGSLTTAVGWDTDKVRQGQDLDVSRSATTTGHIDTAWTVTGTLRPLDLFDVNIGTLTLSKDNVSCAPHLSGGGYSCTATSDGLTLAETPGVPLSPYVDIVLEVKFDITPDGALVTRGLSVGGSSIVGPNSLSLTDSPQSETISMPCTVAAGGTVDYALDPVDWSPATKASQQPAFQIGVMDPITGFARLPAIFNAPFGSPIVTNPSFDLAGPGHTTDMGPLLANNVPPNTNAGGSYSGVEGTPIQFDGTATTSVCGFDSLALRWDFSDGGVAFGAQPFHTFTDNGTYSGQLTATDPTGLSSSQAFIVNVANVPPSVNAGPDTTADWGRPVAFNGQATDPGASDQSTLQYTWSFGDGSPSATGGPSVIHPYAIPGDYTGTLTVCDKDENPATCPSDTRVVHVTKRDTATSYLGDYSGTFDTPGNTSASLVDEYGQAVNGRPIAFQIGTDGPFSASTNSSGIASTAYTPTLGGPASYAAVATFDGSADTLYNSSSSSSTFAEAKKATTTTYTGATTGGPNKTVILSAVLKDATNKPLAGKTIVFQLGSQGPFNATTDASGIASISLKLTQKNGTYTVTATYAGDATHYLGSSQGVIFKLQAK